MEVSGRTTQEIKSSGYRDGGAAMHRDVLYSTRSQDGGSVLQRASGYINVSEIVL